MGRAGRAGVQAIGRAASVLLPRGSGDFEILLALADAPAYPSDLADSLGVSRQSISNHLACLRGCCLVVAVADGGRSRYELADARLGHAIGDLIGVVLAVELGDAVDAVVGSVP